MLVLQQILGISLVASRWYDGSDGEVGWDVCRFEILRNFVVISPTRVMFCAFMKLLVFLEPFEQVSPGAKNTKK